MGIRRSIRDWFVDIALFVLALLFGLVMVSFRVETNDVPDSELLFAADQLTGVLGCLALWLRRRWPVGVAVVLTLASSVSELVGGAAVVALFTVAVHRSLRTTAALFVLGLASTAVFTTLRPEPDIPLYVVVLFGLAVQGAVVGWGLVVRHRRELVESLRERAVRAETEAALRGRTRAAARPRGHRTGDARRARTPVVAAQRACRRAGVPTRAAPEH